jgi:Cu2+-exporting ATPase
MLLEVGIMFTAYWGMRIYEKHRKTTNKPNKNLNVESPNQHQIVRSQKNAMVNPAEKQHQHYYKMSVISMGLSAVRQFFYPPLGLISLCLYIYTAFPQIREAEKSLKKERKVNVDVLFLMGDSITLALNQYFAAAFGMFLLHRGRKTLAKAKGYSERMLFNVFDQQPRKVWLLRENIEVETPLELVKVNDVLVVNTGEVIPVDGILRR